jgi:hypothetical protein
MEKNTNIELTVAIKEVVFVRKRIRERQEAQKAQQPAQVLPLVQSFDPVPQVPEAKLGSFEAWTGRPSNRAASAVTQAQSATQAAQQARNVALAEVTAAEKLIEEEQKALSQIKTGLGE